MKTSPKVSIPFKRESVSKVVDNADKFESIAIVSIPFKRESVSKEIDSRLTAVEINVEVSIPFKRESVSKETFDIVLRRERDAGFNSLQTGKRIQSQHKLKRESQGWQAKFQFPSNGKAYPKATQLTHKR